MNGLVCPTEDQIHRVLWIWDTAVPGASFQIYSEIRRGLGHYCGVKAHSMKKLRQRCERFIVRSSVLGDAQYSAHFYLMRDETKMIQFIGDAIAHSCQTGSGLKVLPRVITNETKTAIAALCPVYEWCATPGAAN